MVRDGGATAGSRDGNGNERGSTRLTFDDFINQIIKQIGFVSSYYRYTEEYVLSHTADWIKRKYEQAVEEKYNESRIRTLENFKGLMLLSDSLFNQGKGFEEIIPPYKELNKKKVEPVKEQFVGGNWWKSE